MKERDIQAQILQHLAYHNIFAWRNNNAPIFDPKRNVFRRMSKYTPQGVSDIIGLTHEGIFIAIEVKQPKKKPTEEQKRFLDEVNQRGGIAFVATSIEDVEKHLGLDNIN